MTQQTEPTIDSGVTRDIYPMPAFVSLEVSDLERTVSWYVEALDFMVLFTMPTLVHLRRWRYQDILVVPGTAEPGRGSTLSISALAAELPALAERARAHGGGTVEGPLDTPWNTRDLRVTDPDGYRLVYSARRPEGERDPAFEEMIRREAQDQLGA